MSAHGTSVDNSRGIHLLRAQARTVGLGYPARNRAAETERTGNAKIPAALDHRRCHRRHTW